MRATSKLLDSFFWLVPLLLLWALLAAPLSGLKTASGQNSGLETASGGFALWQAAPRLGFQGSPEKNASGEPVGANTTGDVAAANWGTGPVRAPARAILENEGVLIDASHGLQSRTSGLFKDVKFGEHGDAKTTYLYTVDERGINVILEKTPFPTPRGNVVHSNISSEASMGGEAWFGPNNSVTINAGSGRFGDAAGITSKQWDATAKLWESLGYKVNAVPFGKR